MTKKAPSLDEKGVPSTSNAAVQVRRVLLLGLVAGYVDALGFVDLNGVYTAAMTGNTVQLGITFVRQQWSHFALIALTLGSFFCGGLISSLIRKRIRRPPAELFIMAGLLIVTEGIRWRTPHLVSVELPLLAIAMAMQGETVSRFGGLSIQTIVVTNTMLKCADAMVAYIGERMNRRRSGADGARPTGIVEIAVPATAWFAYTVGAGGGSAAAMSLRTPLLIPVILLILTACDLLITSPHESA